MTPRCNPDLSYEEYNSFMQNKDYPEDAVGYISAAPDDEEAYKSAIVTLGYLDVEGNGHADIAKVGRFSIKFTTDDVKDQLNYLDEDFIDKFNELIKKHFTKVPDPYKFGKADAAQWAKKKDRSFYQVPEAK